ncbi:MAG: arginine--tRNA ligase [Rhodospirillaceae bacterium]|nr:arginine--tRNA ligase [Rhodospirillaceae bacterium]
MNFFNLIRADLIKSIEELAGEGSLPQGLDLSRINVEPPREASHGDVATNAAMVLAKPAGMKPRDLADLIAARLKSHPDISGLEVAGPGFINLTLHADFWHHRLGEILAAGRRYGDCDEEGKQTVNVEYVSANPTGPMHVGHGRGAVYGDALAALLEKAGHGVTREYYVNDAGAQVDQLARSAHLRYRQALGEEIGAIPEGLYPGDYLIPVGVALVGKFGDKYASAPESDWLAPVRELTIEAMMDLIREDLAALGIRHKVFFSERKMVEGGGVEAALKTLEDKGLIYTGILEPPKGKTLDDWESRPQTLFRATDFGDDVDRALKKADGSWTYFAADIAYHLDKFNRGFASMIDVWGADHGGYVKRMKAAVTAVTGGKGSLDVKICQLVNLLDKGQQVKMSKRAGTFVTLREVVDKVGKDVVRFIMLTRKNDAALDFDLAKVTEQSRDNPVFYVQYAHARCCSVTRLALESFPDLDVSDEALGNAAFHRLTDPSELALIKQLAAWPRLVESAAEAHEPHRCAFYLSEVAAAFHGLWNKGKENEGLRFLVTDDLELTNARMALVRAAAMVIASGLDIFGVEPVEEMR